MWFSGLIYSSTSFYLYLNRMVRFFPFHPNYKQPKRINFWYLKILVRKTKYRKAIRLEEGRRLTIRVKAAELFNLAN